MEVEVRTSRGLGFMLGAIAALAMITAPAGATVSTKTTPVKLGNACTMLRTPKVKAFGSPVKLAVSAFLHEGGCDGLVGADPAQPPGGKLGTFQIFPAADRSFDTSRAAVEDQHAVDSLSQDALEDVSGLGLSAYFNSTKGTFVVAASKKLAFGVTWTPAGTTTLSAADQKKLLALAKDIVKRSPK
jgi:hypothetical protein